MTHANVLDLRRRWHLPRPSHPGPDNHRAGPGAASQAGRIWATGPGLRTLLLTELETPASTTDLARRTGLSPAGVSQCLTTLRSAGLVSAHRAGRSVFYARTAAAGTLLAAASGQRLRRPGTPTVRAGTPRRPRE